MARPKYVQAKGTSLYASITDAEVTAIVLRSLTDIYGNAVAMSDFGDVLYLTVEPGTASEEIISCTGFTVNSDGTVTLNAGITRGIKAFSPYTTGGTARNHAAGAVVVVSNNPQIYEAILDYIDDVAVAGAPNASSTTKGIVEIATASEIDAETATGATGAALAITPDQLALSEYASILTLFSSFTGVVLPYAGSAAPTGFLLCDGSTVDADTYPALAVVIRDRFGVGSLVTFTANSTTDVFTASSHGLSNGNIIFVQSTGTLPAGLSANTPYYIINQTTNTFQLSESSGGAAVNITDTGSGTHSFTNSIKVPDMRGSVPIGSGTRTRTMTFAGDTAVDPSNDQITVTSNDWLLTGQAVALTGSSLPSGLSATTYYVIRVSATVIKLATSVANANAGSAVDITADGSGTCTLTQTLTARTLAATGGEETHALTASEIPAHTHSIGNAMTTAGAGTNSGGSGASNDRDPDITSTGSAGSDTAHNNMPPYNVVTYIIKT